MSRHIKTAEACPNEEKIIKREKILLHVSTLFLAPIWRISHVSLLFLKKSLKMHHSETIYVWIGNVCWQFQTCACS